MSFAPELQRATTVDVLIVGAGLAGASAAAVLGRAGCRVLLVDPHASCPGWFKAEKVEPDQVALFRTLGLLDAVLRHAHHIERVNEGSHGWMIHSYRVEQYGIAYQDLVNAVRSAIPACVDVRADRVLDIEATPDEQRVRLAAGGEVTARLVVLATGTGGKLHERLGISKEMLSADHSLSIGFDISPVGRAGFPFQALTYFPSSRGSRTAYLTLFPIGERMRANLFTFHAAKDPWVRAFQADPVAELKRALAGLARVVGDFAVSSKVEICPIHLYRAAGYLRPGVVLIGDAFQSVDPITGTGLSKVLTDVAVIASRVSRWLSTPGMDFRKVSQYYDDSRKQECDEYSLSSAMYHRRLSEAPALRWQAHHWRAVAAGVWAHALSVCHEWIAAAETLLR